MTWVDWLVGYLLALAVVLQFLRACHSGEVDVGAFNVEHILPTDDLIEHTAGGEECVCGPAVRPVRRDGGWQWVAVHHPLKWESVGRG